MILGVLGAAGLTPARQAYHQSRLLSAEEQKLAALKNQNSKLEERLQRLQDPEYVETLAREQLGLVRPGEVSYVVEPRHVPAPPPKAPSAPEPFYKKAWDWLEGKI